MYKITDLYDLTHSQAISYLQQCEYPWEALKGIKDFIIELGLSLGDDYNEVSEHVWVHKDAKVFDSVQGEGHNIVCFNPSFFRHVEYSEKIYEATKIKYDYRQMEDSIRHYAKNGKERNINSFNENEDLKKEKEFDYLCEWIKYEKNINNK